MFSLEIKVIIARCTTGASFHIVYIYVYVTNKLRVCIRFYVLFFGVILNPRENDGN